MKSKLSINTMAIVLIALMVTVISIGLNGYLLGKQTSVNNPTMCTSIEQSTPWSPAEGQEHWRPIPADSFQQVDWHEYTE